jgi:ubiquinone/menaquinone biosynthesis C-methylase UbiE
MSNKDEFLKGEADNWFNRNRNAVEAKAGNRSGENSPLATLIDWLTPFRGGIDNILEVGSGSGDGLNGLCKALDARGVGIDPSAQAVQHANGKFGGDLTFRVGTADNLAVERDAFDLVHLGFFLYLVDREDYFAAVSQADRAIKRGGFLSIIDFDPVFRHERSYHHKDGVRSYKTKNSSMFVSSGHYSLINKYSFSHEAFHFSKNENERVELVLLYKEPEPYIDYD